MLVVALGAGLALPWGRLIRISGVDPQTPHFAQYEGMPDRLAVLLAGAWRITDRWWLGVGTQVLAVLDAQLALDADGRFIGLRANVLANVGAYISSDRNMLAPFGAMRALTGVYAIPAAYAQVHAIMTNCGSSAPYRGAGRPEATYLVERLIERAAAVLKMDPVKLRQKNFVPKAKMPFTNTSGIVYDSGDFAHVTDECMKISDVAGFKARRAEFELRHGEFHARGT